MADEKALEFRYKLLRVSLLFLGALAFVCGAIWLTGMDPSELSARSQRRFGWMFPWLPWAAIVVFTAFAVLWGRAIFDRSPQLVIGPNGIHARGKTKSPIPWSEIDDIRVRTVAGNHVIELTLKDPSRYLGKGLAAPLFMLNKAFGYTQMGIGTTGLDGSFDDVLEAIKRFHRPAGQAG